MRRILWCAVALAAAALFLPANAYAQAAISGVVKDSAGLALPGVTVEAASPALIEKTRTTVTDASGQYRIEDLRPGVYTVTFTITGFKTLRREGIVLEGSFNAPVSAELDLGSLEETVTVTGETPVVDVVNNRQSVVVNRDMLDAIPTATRSLQARANLIPGTTVTAVGSGQTAMTVHGSRFEDQVVMVDGMRINLLEAQGQYSGIYLNDGMAQEIAYETGAMNAEVAQSGLRVNMIPREGGNRFSGVVFLQGANGPLASDNRSDAVKVFIPEPVGLSHTYEFNPSFGGPIKRDKLWFYFTYKLTDTKSFTSLPDGSQGVLQQWPNWSAVTRVTWQATERDKIRVYVDKQRNGNKAEGLGPQTVFSASHQLWTPTGWTPQIKWTQATTNRLMLDAGFTMYDLNFRREPQSGVDVNELPLFEISNSTTFAGTYSGTMDSWTKNYQVGMAATYVTGAHTFKAGFNHLWGNRTRIWPTPEQRQHLAAALQRRRARTSRRPQHADRGIDRAVERRLRRVRPGRVDDEPTDAEHGRALRLLQRRSARAVGAGEYLGRRPRPCGRRERAQLERLGDSHGGNLRPVRQREDRAQGQRGPLSRVGGVGLRRAVQHADRADAKHARGLISTAIAACSTPTVTCSGTRCSAAPRTSDRSAAPIVPIRR